MTATQLVEKAISDVRGRFTAEWLSDKRRYKRLVKRRIHELGQERSITLLLIWYAIQLFIWWYFSKTHAEIVREAKG